MSKEVLFKAVWSLESNSFNLTLEIKNGKSANWNIDPGNFLALIENAESQLEVKDGQNRLSKNFCFYFIDVSGEKSRINLSKSNTTKSTFVQMIDYLKEVYESWRKYGPLHANEQAN